jgi:putative membrane protein
MDNPNRTRDHLANERTFLAWVRTGLAIVVFGFAIGRFGVAIRQIMQLQGQQPRTTGLSVLFGLISIAGGVLLLFTGLFRYRQTRTQIDAGTFEPAGFVVDIAAGISILLGLALAIYLVSVEYNLH